MKDTRMVGIVAVTAAVVVLAGCGSGGTVGATRPGTGGTGPTGGATPGGGRTTGGPGPVSGSAVGGSGASGASGSSGSKDPCSLVAAATVARLAHLASPAPAGGPSTAPSQDSGGNHYCLIDDGAADSAQIGLGPITKDEFDLQKMDPQTQAVSGLGAEALYSPSDGILKVYKAGAELTVWVIHGGFGGSDPATLAQEKAQEKAIAQVAVPKI